MKRTLQELDAALFELLEERHAAILEASAEPGDPFRRERELVASGQQFAQASGLNLKPLIAALGRLEEDARAHLAESAEVRGDSSTTELPAVKPRGTALVIGGGGRMGAWMADFLALSGWEVSVCDPAGSPAGYPLVARWEDDPLQQDLVVVAAPLRPSNDILHALAERRPRGTVFDIGSLKSPLRTGLEALLQAGVPVTSVHPMFGPDVTLLHGRHVIFADVGDSAACDLAEALFAHTEARRLRMSLEDHDRVMAFVLGLSHALNIAFVTAVAESGEAAPRLAELSSTTFEAQLDVARRVVRENPHLYYEIQRLNDFGDEALRALDEAVARVRTIVQSGDEAAFVSLMEQGDRYVRGR